MTYHRNQYQPCALRSLWPQTRWPPEYAPEPPDCGIQVELSQIKELARLAVVVRDSHDAITVQDLDGRTLAWNPGAVRLYGWTEAQALAMNIRSRIPQGN